MKRADVIHLSNDWWMDDRKPAKDLVIKSKRTKLPAKLYTVKEMAERLNVGIWGLYDAIKLRELKAEVVGKRFRISEEAMLDYLDLCSQKKRIS